MTTQHSSYNPTIRGLIDAIAVLSDTLREPLVITRTAYGYHLSTASSGHDITPPCANATALYDEVLLCNIM